LAFPGRPTNVGTVTFEGIERFVFQRTDVNVVVTYDRIARRPSTSSLRRRGSGDAIPLRRREARGPPGLASRSP
jgi:hypothetical protein